MVLEGITNVIKAEKKPAHLLLIGFLYATVGIFLSLWIFREYSSMIMVFLTTFVSVPLIYSLIKMEETKDIEIEEETTLIREHSKAFLVILFLFIGATLAYGFWYTSLPTEIVTTLYDSQTKTIEGINNYAAGGAIRSTRLFTLILANNIKVLTFCIFFAFIYGFGAIFILLWNASVIGAAIGNLIRTKLASYTATTGLGKLAAYFQIFSLSLMRYFLHGIPEILAYVVGGLAGGIISIAIVRHDFGTKRFEKILFDSSTLVILSLMILVFAAFVEVYITPVLF